MDMELCSVGGRKRCVITHGTTVKKGMTCMKLSPSDHQSRLNTVCTFFFALLHSMKLVQTLY